MPITYDDDPNTLIPTDLTALSMEELLEFRDELKDRVRGIQEQITAYKLGGNPEHMQTVDWRRRAGCAHQWYKRELDRLKLELTRRHQVALHAKGATEKERQANKEKNISRALEETRISAKAFVEASKTVLSKESYLEIWRLAREMFPEAFASQTAG